MNGCIDAIEKANIYDSSGAEGNDNKIKELAEKFIKNMNILKSLLIND